MTKFSQLASGTDDATAALTQQEKDLFNFVVACVNRECRFPTNEWILRETSLPIRLLPDLARRGYLRIIIYKRQLRQVEICSGPMNGYSTLKPPGAVEIIKIIDKDSPPV